MKNLIKLTTLVCVLVFLLAMISSAKDIHVPGDFDKIQDALNAALSGDRVLVAAGTYEGNITLKSGVELLGAGADVTTIKASTGDVVTASDVSFRTSISGFTIDGVDKSGGIEHGIFCVFSSPVISNVTIINTGWRGIYCNYSSPTISNVTITNTGGDGIFCSSSSPPISNVTITNTEGNGIFCEINSSPTISDVAITAAKGDGILCFDYSEPKIRGSVISQNFLNGIKIESDALPDIGTEADPGGNSIFNNGNFDVLNVTSTEVKAELNWWGQSPPNPAFFSGLVDYDPWLTEPPLPFPSITSVSPNAGPLAGGTWITITGTHFATGATVTIGGNPATDVTVVSETKITAKTPAGTAGAKDVRVTNPDGQFAILPNGFFYATIPKTGDVSGNGTISAYDAALILQYVVGLIDCFPADCPVSQAAQRYISGEITIDELDRILQKLGYPSVFKLLGFENQLLQNYPNPFNPETWIPFKLAQNAPVTISIYDAKGQLIRTIFVGNKPAGVYLTKDKAAYWDGRDNAGEKVSSGVYFYTLEAGKFRSTRKLVIVK